MINKYLEDDLIIITSSSNKRKILLELSVCDKIYDIKFMTKEEFFSNYLFKYNDEAVYYLMKKYDYNVEVARKYLDNLYFIDDITYKSSKLNKLKSLKEELVLNNLLIINPSFKEFISAKKIIVYNCCDLEKYEEEILTSLNSNFITLDNGLYKHDEVYEFKTLESEIVSILCLITKLLSKGVELNNIHLVNVNSSNYYQLDRLFKYFNIPLNIDFNNSIIGTRVVSKYLENGSIDYNDTSIINKKLISVINSLVKIDDDKYRRKILITKLKHTSISSDKISCAVNISDISSGFSDEDYVFMMGFNQDIYPRIYKDDDLINDKEKEEVPLYKTDYKNTRIKEKAINDIKRIKNLTLSYHLEDSFNTYFKSNLIDDLGMNIITEELDVYNYSNRYNTFLLASLLDEYTKYGTSSNTLKKLYSTYPNIAYNTYDNSFTGINNNTYLSYIKNPLGLSYTSINNYNLCGFKYYINYVLRIDPYEDSFSAITGSMFHEALTYLFNDNFDLDIFFNNYIENRDFTFKELFFLRNLKLDLKETMSIIYEQREYTKYRETYFEKEIEVALPNTRVILKGTIDKIMFYRNIYDTYYTLIDYKSGSYDNKIDNIKYGLSMQLPLYLYLVEKSRLFTNSIFTGFYYQNILLPKKKYNEDALTLKLDGYSTSNKDVLEMFDNSYEKSDVIKGMRLKQDGQFYSSSKILTDNDIDSLLKEVEDKVNECSNNILNANFLINPKVLKGNNVSCKYCKYRDLCFMIPKDLIYLDDSEVEEDELD